MIGSFIWEVTGTTAWGLINDQKLERREQG